MSDLITPDLVLLDRDLGGSTDSVIRELAATVHRQGRARDADSLAADALAREAKNATGIPGGIGIPHCRSEAVTRATLVMARLAPPVDFGAKDGPADVVFFIAAPAGADQEHLKLLSKLARSLMKKPFVASLRAAATPEEVVGIVDGALGLGPVPDDASRPAAGGADPAAGGTTTGASGSSAATAPGTASSGTVASGTASSAPLAGDPQSPSTGAPGADPGTAASAGAVGGAAAASFVANGSPEDRTAGTGGEQRGPRRLVAVTACPTGIAHTYMAADALANTAQEMGVELQVETQGSSGATRLDPQVIAQAEAVIFATDVDVRERTRFAGLPYIASAVKRGIDEPREMIEEALAAAEDPRAPRVTGDGTDTADALTGSEGWGSRIRKAVMTGVSYMIPFVAAGGLLMAIAFMIADPVLVAQQADDILGTATLGNLGDVSLSMYLGAVLFKIGNLAISLLVPALAGYIAYGLADRPGIAPGFAAGLVANFMGAGFIGGIVGGLLAGLCAYWLTLPKLPRWLGSLMPVVIIPLLASLFAGGLLFLVIGGPIAMFMTWLTSVLAGMSGASAVTLGAVLGLMMCSDLGGPINKVAYSFAVAGLGAATATNTAPQEIMATVIASGMVPPLGLALASTVLGRRYFTAAERENGKTSWLLGASFISEGAIPFAAADPLRVIPASMLGGVVTGAMTMAFGVTSAAPHGGIWILPVIDGRLAFVASILVGTVITGVVVTVLKRFGHVEKSVGEVPGVPQTKQTVEV
ncbi:fructose-specific PTS transporter subunit EIIC [Glutamicibacter protophormiae]|uniref:PTS fructose transporter subunit IIABC n=1 Tax=Kocuria TaxID=57493 RepID=UPI0006D79AC7|nr:MULTISPECIES: fructose-specific PTS transporter subunit EIIC [Kocuria]MDN5632280.1 fructose-specific PTS transporter subunit EIIC [Kocuria sp.]WNB87890.1 fructose-specific PTS transporter subunit EIIC [Glutamicibacter protophormiae]